LGTLADLQSAAIQGLGLQELSSADDSYSMVLQHVIVAFSVAVIVVRRGGGTSVPP
jgi:hypothetical protein